MLRRFSLLGLMALISACQGGKLTQDPEAIKKASIMTSQCILNYPEVPGKLTLRQTCLNNASGTLLNYYNPEIRAVALECAQRLTELAKAADSQQVNINQYEQAKQNLHTQCESTAKAKLTDKP